jgi:hypothetical protein
LTFACGNYDRMAALRTGDVCIEGIDLNYVAIDSPREIFDRMGGRQEFDLAEFSSSEFISRFVRGDYSLVALPVFPSRVFRHGHIYINRRSGIKHPKNLEHRRVGVALYTQTAAVWIRGHLAHQYGVDLSTIAWLEGAVEKSGPHGHPSAPPLLKSAAVERNTSGRSLSELLAAGDIDALAGGRHLRPIPTWFHCLPTQKQSSGLFFSKPAFFRSCISLPCAVTATSAIHGSQAVSTRLSSRPRIVHSRNCIAGERTRICFRGWNMRCARLTRSSAEIHGRTASTPIGQL